LGDAAHSFLPTSGNGAVQAIEDGVNLGECLRIGGKENLEWGVKVHNKLRFQRTSILQQAGFLNREELHTTNISTAHHYDPTAPQDTALGFFKQGRWIWAHKPEEYAGEKYAECLEFLQQGKGEEFVNTNIPPGHLYHPWSLASENERMRNHEPSELKEKGYWGTETEPFVGRCGY
jgi:hypothetical protein